MNEIFWIKSDSPQSLAVVLRPRGDDWLEDELRRMKQGGIQILVSLLEEEESGSLGLAQEGPVAERIGMQFLSYPIPDVHVPRDPDSFSRFAMELADRIRDGIRVGIHCRGSIGRATITAACVLINLGWKPKVALEAVGTARGIAVPDTQEQKDWILSYRPLANHLPFVPESR
jgi:protein-tyrosine phosphatase